MRTLRFGDIAANLLCAAICSSALASPVDEFALNGFDPKPAHATSSPVENSYPASSYNLHLGHRRTAQVVTATIPYAVYEGLFPRTDLLVSGIFHSRNPDHSDLVIESPATPKSAGFLIGLTRDQLITSEPSNQGLNRVHVAALNGNGALWEGRTINDGPLAESSRQIMGLSTHAKTITRWRRRIFSRDYSDFLNPARERQNWWRVHNEILQFSFIDVYVGRDAMLQGAFRLARIPMDRIRIKPHFAPPRTVHSANGLAVVPRTTNHIPTRPDSAVH